jgi:hypothetical protein
MIMMKNPGYRPEPSYAAGMTSSPLSPDDIRAAAEVHDELGPEYSDAVVASFLQKVDREIAARVEARLADVSRSSPPKAQPEAARLDSYRALLRGTAIGLAVSLIPLLWFWDLGSRSPEQNAGRGLIILAWVVTTILCAAGSIKTRPQGARRPSQAHR